MFLIPGINALITFIYLRPQEIFEFLRPVTFAWIVGLLALGYVLDSRLGVTRLRTSSPLFGVSLALFVLALVTVAAKAPDKIGDQLTLLLPSLIVFLFVSQGLQTLRAISVAAAVVLALTLLVSAVAVEQGFSAPVCFMYGNAEGVGKGETIDGRSCVTPRDCVEGGLPGRDFECEKPGILNTRSIGKRVRFRGLLEDPNELAWVISMGVPLAFAFYERRRSSSRLALLIVTVVLSTVCVVMTQSRSGQMSLAAVLGVYFIRRFGWRGAVAAAIATAPLLLYGGRSGSDADSSSEERLGCWNEALSMWRENPFLGVGQGQFTEHHYLTAHSSIMLTLAEMGPGGLILWTIVIYLAFKITIRVQADFADREETRAARTWATALLSSMVGLLVSAFFLSIPFNEILWTFLGMVGALHATVRAHEPRWRVRFGLKDVALVIGLDTATIAFVAFYIRLKGV